MRNPILRFAQATLLLAAFGGCATAPPVPTAPRRPLLLISVDGLRPTDVTPSQMPNLSRLAQQGVRAAWMKPSYPSLTFPNHYTIVTGLTPDHHGIVHNNMSDPVLGRFKLSDNKAVGDGRWWGGMPVWVSVERAGLHASTMYWPGSQAAIQGVRPSHWETFDDKRSAQDRAKSVARWMLEPAGQRPDFATLYFDSVDHAEHDHGPDSPEARDQRSVTDAAIGTLVSTLAAKGVLDRVDIVVVSDHGFASVPKGHATAVDALAPASVATAVSNGQVVTFDPLPGHADEANRMLLGRHDHATCWRKQDLPRRWHYGSNPRIPPIVCQMDEGWDAVSTNELKKPERKQDRGSHGFDPDLPSMRATFIARGPSFKAGTTLPGFENVDVYPLLMRLLQLPPQHNDGHARTFDAVLTPGVAR